MLHRHFLVYAAVAFLMSDIGQGQTFWTQLTTTDAGAITCLHQRGDTLLAGTHGGIYRSLDSGNTWAQTTLRSASVAAIASNETGLCAAATPSGVFVSTDGGATWKATRLSTVVFSMAVDREGRLFAGSGGWDQYAHICISADSGKTWSKVKMDGPRSKDSRVIDLLVTNTGSILAGTEFLNVSPQGFIYRSGDHGETWPEAMVMETYYSSLTKNSKGDLFAATNDGRLLKSINDGMRWEPIEPGLHAGWLVSDIVFTNDGYALASSDALHRSKDASLSAWTIADSISLDCLLAPFSGSTFGASSAGLFRSNDSGSGWRKSMKGISAEQALGLAVDRRDCLWMLGKRSTDHGRHWESAIGLQSIDFIFSDPDGWLFAWNRTNNILLRSSDGVSWELLESNAVLRDIRFMKRIRNWLLCGGSYGLARSGDNGTTWEIVSRDGMLDAIQTKDGQYFFTRQYFGVYRADSNWTNLALSSEGLPEEQYPEDKYYMIFSQKLTVDADGNLYCGVSGHGLYRSTDNGQHWGSILVEGSTIREICLIEPGTIVLATHGNGVAFSTDNGATWARRNDGLTNPRVLSIAMDSTGFIYAGTDGSGVFRSTKSIFPCVADLRMSSDTGLIVRKHDTLAIPLRIQPSLKPRDDFTLSATILYDDDRLVFAGVHVDSLQGFTADASVISAGKLRLLMDGVSLSGGDTLLQLYFFVKETGENDLRTIVRFDSLVAATRCETAITSEDVAITLRASPSRWDISVSPNPASGRIVLIVSSPRTEEVQMAMTDILGRNILHLFHGVLQEGVHSMQFDIRELSSGSYWIRLDTPGFRTHKRLAVVK
jgi:photosystem II stability/assembly factor-like uncharacterized protein